jgi:hypothetical protein
MEPGRHIDALAGASPFYPKKKTMVYGVPSPQRQFSIPAPTPTSARATVVLMRIALLVSRNLLGLLGTGTREEEKCGTFPP